jgi:hypothetical protein
MKGGSETVMGNLISVCQLRNQPLISPAFGVINLKHGNFNIYCKIQYSLLASVNSDDGRYVDEVIYFFRDFNIKIA